MSACQEGHLQHPVVVATAVVGNIAAEIAVAAVVAVAVVAVDAAGRCLGDFDFLVDYS